MQRSTIRKTGSLILALLVTISLASCSQINQTSGSPPRVSVSKNLPGDFPGSHQDKIAEYYDINSDTVGWLHIPGTEVNDVVVCLQDPSDINRYYLRRDIYKNDGVQEGIYFADCRNKFDGTANGLSHNTTIYGHSREIPDDPDGPRFSQLKKYWDEDFARNNPYIYFSIDGHDLVWEIFAAFYTNAQFTDSANDYINPLDGYAKNEINAWLSRAKERSEYIYDVKVSPNDRFLTLSTCLYHLADNKYPNDYRWVIAAKLVQDGKYKDAANLELNPEPMSPDLRNY